MMVDPAFQGQRELKNLVHIWELSKIGDPDPNIVPEMVGSLLEGPQIRYP